MEYVKIATKYGLNMSYMQAKCKESEVTALGMQTKTYLTWTLNAILTWNKHVKDSIQIQSNLNK